jgi:GDP/UDP-N,N'-diacetylbacillosamine 2-epimerase (hydrolysing)
VIDCPPTKNGINSAFKKLYSPNFQKILCSLKNPYESQDGSKIILEVTLDYLKTRKDIKKEFFDISVKNI